MSRNNTFAYDLMVNFVYERKLSEVLDNATIEVKRDYGYIKTGNVFVEYKFNGKPSGLSTSSALYYCFFLSDTVFIFIETKELKALCRKYLGTNRDVKGGDHNASLGVLLPLNELFLKKDIK